MKKKFVEMLSTDYLIESAFGVAGTDIAVDRGFRRALRGAARWRCVRVTAPQCIDDNRGAFPSASSRYIACKGSGDTDCIK